jgi:serine/threonine protein kinase
MKHPIVTDGTRAAREHGDLPDGEADPRVFAAMQEYMAEIDAGRHPNRKEFLARHPEIAGELSECLQGLAFVRSATPGITGSTAHPPVIAAAAAEAQRRAEAELTGAAQPLGDFRLVREIGRGGMGVVYEAVQLSLGRRVAVKVLPLAGALDPRQLQRFRNEAQAAAQLHHTNIVPVYAVGYERSVHFYAMQYIEGQSLADVIRELRRAAGRPAGPGPGQSHKRGASSGGGGGAAAAASRERTLSAPEPPSVTANGVTDPAADRWRAVMNGGGGGFGAGSLPRATENLTALHGGNKKSSFFEAAARLGLQAAEALEYAHQVGVVHRDIKPANLLLDVQGILWITDFGLAQLQTDSGLTQPGDMLGTFRYMSPEQASGKAVVLDQRTDIYSLGLTLYELLTLERGLQGETREQLLYQIGYVDPRPPRSIDPAIPPELETILAKATAKEPAERYATARAMADDLRRFLQNEPIRARPPSLRDRTVKWMRRHKPVVASALVMLVLAAVGLLTSTILVAREQTKTEAALIREREQRARAERGFREAREAVDFFANMAADEMSDPVRMFEARKHMLEASLGYYERFIVASRDNPAVGAELNAAQARISGIVEELAAFREWFLVWERRNLLDHDPVRAALQLTPEQGKDVDKFRAEWPAQPEALAGFRPLTPEEKAEQFTAEAAEGEARLARILTAAQSERLKQVAMQLRGLSAFIDSALADELEFTPEQRQMIRLTQDMHREKSFPLRRNFRFDEVWRLERAAIADIVNHLTPGQRTRWEQLTGPPLPREHYPRPRRPEPPSDGRREKAGGVVAEWWWPHIV